MLRNSASAYGSLAKFFHWSIALLMLTVIPLGVIAHDMAYDTAELLARKALLFSLHKTIGVAIFFIALARITWMLSNEKPRPLHPERRVEAIAAEGAHWLLYGALLVMPLTGWIGHAATEGFAPIWWPFGQSLPFIPKSAVLATTMEHMHAVARFTLIGALLAHIAGALKHHAIDKDATLKRMWFTKSSEALVAPEQSQAHSSKTPFLGAIAIWAAVLGAGYLTAPHTQREAQTTITPTGDGFWQIEDGEISFNVTQFGSATSGRFAAWSSDITYDRETKTGHVRTSISISSATIGTLTTEALGAAYFDGATYPEAIFEGDVSHDGTTHTATGTLTLKGTSLPVSFPFILELSDTDRGTQANMSADLTLDRRDFGIGDASTDTLLPEVAIEITLTAKAP